MYKRQSQDCSDVEICDILKCYPLTECFTVTKTRIVNRPYTKCNRVPYNDCQNVPKNVCENGWKSNCTEVLLILCIDILMKKIIDFFFHSVDGNSTGHDKSYT